MLAIGTQVYSSGPIAAIVSSAEGELGRARFPRDEPVRRVVVRVRVARPAGSRLRLELVAPDGGVWRLPFRRRAVRGNGARGCRGPALRFDTDALRDGASFLREWHDSAGTWTLRASGRGVVACWQLWVTGGRPSVKRASAAGTSASLASLEIDGWSAAYRVSIARLGHPADIPPLECALCVQAPRIAVRDVDGDRDPEVFAEFWLGGAHCCPVSVIYRHAGPGRYTSTLVEWPGEGVGYRLRDLDADGRPEFVSASDFECAFASCAGSVFPLRIWDYRSGTFVDVTARFPARVRAQAGRFWRVYRDSALRNHPYRQYLAAWAADQHVLGRGRAAMRWISYHAPRRYVVELRQLLAGWGYDGSGRCPKAMCRR